MELKQLEYFLAVSKLKSFTLAADQLYISQPGITAAIRRLEDELGVTLFVKKRKSAVLTPEGEVFATHVQHVITDMHGALQELDKLKNLHQGRIRIGITPISGISSPAYLLAKFKVMYPELQLELVEGSSLQLEQQLEQDALDMAFLVGTQPFNGLENLSLTNVELVVGLPAIHYLAKKPGLRPQQLTRESFLLLQDDTSPVRQAIAASFATDHAAMHIALETNYVQTIQRLVLCGAGLCILPAECFEGHTNLVGVPLEPSLQLTIYACYRQAHNMSQATETFLAFVRSACEI